MEKKCLSRSLWVLGIVVLLSPFLAVVGWIASAAWSNDHPERGVAEPGVDWLPAGASDVSYFKTYSFSAYEFHISEDGFRAWATEVELCEISAPVSIERYNRWDPQVSSSEQMATITQGLWGETPRRGNGGGTRMVFDRETGTAYFQHSPR